MRTRLAWLLVCGFLVMAGQVLGESNLRELEIGMPRAEVISLLGEPRGRGSDGRREILFYGVDREVHLQDGFVYMVTGAEGLVQERARGVAGTPQHTEAQTDSLQIRHEFSHTGPSFTVEGMDDMPPWAVALVMGFLVVVIVFMIATMWCLFEKAGFPGWTSLVPMYNAYVMLKIAGKPGWWLFLMLLPLVNVVIAVILPFSIAFRFGKGAGFGLGLLLFPWLFYAILAFGRAAYEPLE